MLLNVVTHELANELSGGLVLRPARLKEFVAQVALHSDAESRILRHVNSVANGYTLANRFVHRMSSWSSAVAAMIHLSAAVVMTAPRPH